MHAVIAWAKVGLMLTEKSINEIALGVFEIIFIIIKNLNL